MLNYLLFMVMPVLIWLAFSIIYNKPINSSDQLRQRYLIVCGFCLFFVLAFRHYSVGSGDGGWYYRNWLLLSNMNIDEFWNALEGIDMETGYLFSIWILSHILKDPQFVFITYGLLVSIAICRFLYKNSGDLVLGFTMFNTLGLWGFMVQGLRQGIAMCICLFAVEFAQKRKLIPFLAVVLLASFFHASAVVFFVVYLFSFFKMEVKSYIGITVCVWLSVYLIDWLFNIVNAAMNDEFLSGDIERTSGGFITALIYILILALGIYLFRHNQEDDTKAAFFFYMALCGFVTFALRYTANTISQRVSYYFMFAQMAVLPSVLDRFRGRGQMLVRGGAIILCIMIAVYKSSYSPLIPYIFFWQAS